MAQPYARLKLEPAYRKVAAALTESITSGALRVGERLPSETELGLRMGVHRSTVREALRELESAGLLRRERGSKLMMVSRPDRDTVASGVTRALTLHEATVAEVWEALTVIEPMVAELAARRRDAAALATLAAVVESAAPAAPASATQEGAADLAATQAAEFFRALAAVAGNRVLSMSHEPLLQLMASSLHKLVAAVPQARSRIAAAQRRILEAVERGDAAAAREWCGKHVRDYRRGFEVAGIDLALPISSASARPSGRRRTPSTAVPRASR
ncbi:MAG: FadR/GntR family transcriptional regulator, partial [Gammaproteobacteria bacterium]